MLSLHLAISVSRPNYGQKTIWPGQMRVFIRPHWKHEVQMANTWFGQNPEAVFERDEVVIEKRPKNIWPDWEKNQAKFAAEQWLLLQKVTFQIKG